VARVNRLGDVSDRDFGKHDQQNVKKRGRDKAREEIGADLTARS
jgi:hypothetical protein